MKLLRLKLTNFKGVSSFEIDTKGEDVTLYGDNGTGKTTVKDAVSWLLFDKSSDDKKMNPKTVNKDGSEKHNIDHVAEVVLLNEGREIKLRKVFFEKYTKKRGSVSETFTGHKTDYFIDDVPVSKKEYTERTGEICTLENFKLLSDVDYFAGKLHWEKRREMLLDLCGDVDDDAVLKDMPELAKAIDGHTVEDFVKIIKAKMKKINKELTSIPTKIDEATIAKTEVEISESESRENAENISVKLSIAKKELVDTGTSKELEGMQAELSKLNISMDRVVGDFSISISKKVNALNTDIIGIDAEINNLKSSVSKVGVIDVAAFEEKLKTLKSEWYLIRDMVFTDDKCPTCGREYDDVGSSLDAFNLRKSKMLEVNVEEGKETAKQLADAVISNEKATILVKSLNDKIESESAKKASLENEITEISASAPDTGNLSKEIESLEGKISTHNTPDTGKIDEKIALLEEEYGNAVGVIASIKANKKQDKRVEHLYSEESLLGKEYIKTEQLLFLCEDYTRKKVELIESNVAKMFKVVRFKMFQEQINGGLNECCEVIVDGVQYNVGLNSGAKINAGVDIINTLSKRIGKSVPLIVDNAEGCTSLINTDAQVIRLAVSGNHKTLTMEA